MSTSPGGSKEFEANFSLWVGGGYSLHRRRPRYACGAGAATAASERPLGFWGFVEIKPGKADGQDPAGRPTCAPGQPRPAPLATARPAATWRCARRPASTTGSPRTSASAARPSFSIRRRSSIPLNLGNGFYGVARLPARRASRYSLPTRYSSWLRGATSTKRKTGRTARRPTMRRRGRARDGVAEAQVAIARRSPSRSACSSSPSPAPTLAALAAGRVVVVPLRLRHRAERSRRDAPDTRRPPRRRGPEPGGKISERAAPRASSPPSTTGDGSSGSRAA